MDPTNTNSQTEVVTQDLETFFRTQQTHARNFLRSRFSALSEEDIQDVVQDASIALYENITGGRWQTLTTSLLNYYLSICNNTALYRVRKQKASRIVDYDLTPRADVSPLQDEAPMLSSKMDELDALLTDGDAQGEQYHQQLDAKEEQIRQAVLHMPEPCNHLLWGQYWDHLSHKTMAQMYGFKNASVSKTTASRCRDKFSRYLKQLNITL